MKRIPYGRHFVSEEDIAAVNEVLRSDFLTQGPKVQEFEEDFARYIGAKYCVAVSNGTAALHLATKILDCKEGDRVITTPNTFSASANCVRYTGGRVDFVDIDPESFLMDADKLYQKLKKATRGTYKGIIPVDFAGYPQNTEKLRDIADEFGLWIIEDACHAPGGYFQSSKHGKVFCGDGQLAEIGIFSFHPVKHIATAEGGMLSTNNEEFYKRLLYLRSHGITKDPELMHENHGGWYYEMIELSHNYRMTELQGALGISQLKRADENLEIRTQQALRYHKAFENTKVKCPKMPENGKHALHLYVIQVEDRKGLYDHLVANQIFAQVHYIPVHLMPYYKNMGWKNGDFPVVENYYQHCLSIPLFPTLTEEEQNFVIEKILEFTE